MESVKWRRKYLRDERDAVLDRLPNLLRVVLDRVGGAQHVGYALVDYSRYLRTRDRERENKGRAGAGRPLLVLVQWFIVLVRGGTEGIAL